ncbi:hypothetical protein [Streptomyces sp. HD]|uniref:hypothetical protein n=1 Tax=Streptomyces sp. HD TaxID=3020892 RepID=UPI00232ACE2D|nr:hypothetical protein [Streptomyces sp. HD]MDC0771458.1 hypothetical protein [Streptomyces sp. HD]
MTRTPLFALRILDGRHEMTVTRLKRADDSFTLHYTVTPPLPDSGSEPPLVPVLEARDDLDNTYDDRGGAYGTAPAAIGGLAAPRVSPSAGGVRLQPGEARSSESAAPELRLRNPRGACGPVSRRAGSAC